MITALRGLKVLETLAGMRQPAPLREIAERIELSQSQTFRILQALADDAYVDHLGRSGYRLGSRSVALGTLVGPRPLLVRSVRPALGRLAVATGEAAVLHLRTGGTRVLILGIAPPTGPIRDPAAVLGERSPLASGASGRVILAHLPPDEAAQAGPGADPAELAVIRERGYDTSLGENHPGINGLSGPLLTDDGRALGSVSLAGPAEELPDPASPRLVRPLLAACRELSPIVAGLLGPDPGSVLEALDIGQAR